MNRKRVGLASAAVGFAGFVAAVSRAWAGAVKETWTLDDELAEDDDDVAPEQRPFLPLLTGERPPEPTA
ncbi:MAG TPA: hypothetical protein VKA30_01620 [Actinomycetota bacterium]|nr:hypothetical protein [Actinomycetota bacterium]